MRALMIGALLLCVGGAPAIARAADTAPKGAPKEVRESRDEAQHHLLMLDLREAAEHAKTLHHYAAVHAGNLDSVVVKRHADELAKNLEGIEAGLKAIEENPDPRGGIPFEPKLADVRDLERRAWHEVDALHVEAAKSKPDRHVVAASALTIWQDMSRAVEHHRDVMQRHDIREPEPPAPGH